MRILLFNLYFHPDPTGTGLIIGELGRELARLGHEVTAVTTVPHYGLDAPDPAYRGRFIYEDRWEGVRVLRTAVRSSRNKSLFSRLVNYMSYALLAIPAGLRGPRPDVVIGVLPPVTTAPTLWLVSRLRHAPLVLSVQDVYPDAVFKRKLAAWVNRTVERFILRSATRVTALSESQRQAAIARGADPARTEVIPMWTDLEGVRPGPVQNAFRAEHAPDAKLVALYAGNLGAFSGVGVILDAANELRDDPRIRFLIVGRGHAREGLMQRARELNLPNLTFLLTQPRERLNEMLAAADVGLVTLDMRLSETSVPSKTFTIMASGRPVLAAISERNEIARVVRESGCGAVVPADGVSEMAATLRGWADEPGSLGAMGVRGRQWAERFNSRQPAILAHEEWLRKAIGAHQGVK